jgi:acetyl esterase/lipase
MRNCSLLVVSLLLTCIVSAQKKPLDHTVYDQWQSIGERMISDDGKWIAYAVNTQEGDNELIIQSADTTYRRVIARGYNASFTGDNRYLVCRIRPFYKDTREARIRKKKPEDMPKDSLAVLELAKDSLWTVSRVKGYKLPAESYGWLAYLTDKKTEPARPRSTTDNKKAADSLSRLVDSLRQVIAAQSVKSSKKKKDEADDDDMEYYFDAEGDESGAAGGDAGSDLFLRKLPGTQQYTFQRILDYAFDKNGSKLLLEQARDSKDSTSHHLVLLFDLRKGYADTLSRGGNDFRGFSFSDDGEQLAFLAERDAKPKELQKFYRIWYYRAGMDSASLLVDKNSPGMKLGMTISEYGLLNFSKNGQRLFFGTAPIQPPKDTSLVEMDLVKLDIWHYKDDYLQTQQLYRLQRDLEENFLAVYNFDNSTIHQLATIDLPAVYLTNEGNGDRVVGVTDYGRRIESQWRGNTLKDIYTIDLKDGSRHLIKKNLDGQFIPSWISPTGRYVMWYDFKSRGYFVWDGDTTRNITRGITTALYNEETDTPSDPGPYGVMGWAEADAAVYIYDRYDIWKVYPTRHTAPVNITGNGRSTRTTYRYMRVNPDERFLTSGQDIFMRRFNETTKEAGLLTGQLSQSLVLREFAGGKYSYGQLTKAKESAALLYTRENFTDNPDIYLSKPARTDVPHQGYAQNREEWQLSRINPQQKEYNWGTASLYKWKTFSGKNVEGILYKPENFDPKKKYPMIVYFYERLSDGLYTYQAPSPTPSRLNISFFVSRGYLVFAPDIRYTIGHPAKSAYEYIVSGTRELMKEKWVDGKNIGLQGQSWGGIQVAQLITMTDIYKAAWAGAPVANMTSAYGGIRWESGVNRQFQYEKTQSRIGATLWEKPELYIENSPLFHLPKVKTPLVIMANDADGAVPWYQGIELFTGMRRLGKQVWMLNYNGEAHNLVQRKNRRDIQVRQQQFFDWLLKGDKPGQWIVDGVPAVKKGKDWGLDIVD